MPKQGRYITVTRLPSLTVSAAQRTSTIVAVLHSEDLPPDPDARVAHSGTAKITYSTGDQLADTLPGADSLLVWDFTIGDALRTSWAHADALRWVHTASAGVDRLIFDEMVTSDVVITNSRGVFDTAMAEYVLGAVLAFVKDLPITLSLQQRCEWRHRETETIAGRIAVVVSSSPIGKATAAMLGAVGMRVHVLGRRSQPGCCPPTS
jgi:phosphoglycerate dehydrogenase-like enzyme